MIHRDIKPDNFLVGGGTGSQGPEHVYLADFGLTHDNTRSASRRPDSSWGLSPTSPRNRFAAAR